MLAISLQLGFMIILSQGRPTLGYFLRPCRHWVRVSAWLYKLYTQAVIETSMILTQEMQECNKIQLHHHLINKCLVWPLHLHPDQFLYVYLEQFGSIGCASTEVLIGNLLYLYDVHCHCQFLHCCTPCTKVGTTLWFTRTVFFNFLISRAWRHLIT